MNQLLEPYSNTKTSSLLNTFGACRFGFQGQQTEDELYGEGNASFFKYRISDNRLGRFFAIDPLASKYPHNSPYAFSENRVIDGVELEGLEYQPNISAWQTKTREAQIEMQTSNMVAKEISPIVINYVESSADVIVYTTSSFVSAMVAGLTAAANDDPHNYVKIPALNFKFSNPYLIGKEDAPLEENISFDNAKRLMNGTTSIVTTILPLAQSSVIGAGQSIVLDKLGSSQNTNKNNSTSFKGNTNSNYGSYKIQQGDNLTKIAKNYNTTVNKLVKINNIKNSDIIKAGQTLKLQ